MTPEHASHAKTLISRADLKGAEIPAVVEVLNALSAIEDGTMICQLAEPIDDKAELKRQQKIEADGEAMRGGK